MAQINAAPRREPRQARGERRILAILDAAAELISEVGYDAATLTAVAERSNSAIGSLYHFFANKDELADALADRIADKYRNVPARVLRAPLKAMPLESFVDAIIEPLAAVATASPVIAEIMPRVVARTPSLSEEIQARLGEILSARAPGLSAAEHRIVVRVTMELVRSGMRLIARSPKHTRRAVVAEVKLCLIGYLALRIA